MDESEFNLLWSDSRVYIWCHTRELRQQSVVLIMSWFWWCICEKEICQNLMNRTYYLMNLAWRRLYFSIFKELVGLIVNEFVSMIMIIWNLLHKIFYVKERKGQCCSGPHWLWVNRKLMKMGHHVHFNERNPGTCIIWTI